MADLHRPYVLSFEEHSGYLLAKVTSDRMTADLAKEYLGKIAAKISETGAKRLMMFRDVSMMLSDPDLFDVTNFFLDLMRGKRVAFVNPHMEIKEDMEFAVRIGTNRGGLYKLFNNIPDAKKWLLDTEKKFPSQRSHSAK